MICSIDTGTAMSSDFGRSRHNQKVTAHFRFPEMGCNSDHVM